MKQHSQHHPGRLAVVVSSLATAAMVIGFLPSPAQAAPLPAQPAVVGAQVSVKVAASASCKSQVNANVTAQVQQLVLAKQAQDPTFKPSRATVRAAVKAAVLQTEQGACNATGTATVTGVQSSNVQPPASALAAQAAHTKKGTVHAAALPATQQINISWAICDSAPGGCGIWSATNHTISNFDGLWAWDGMGPPNCQYYTTWWAIYNNDYCGFPWWVGGAWQANSYLLSRDRFDIKLGVNVFGQLIVTGPYYHDVYINLDPNGWFQEGSNNS